MKKENTCLESGLTGFERPDLVKSYLFNDWPGKDKGVTREAIITGSNLFSEMGSSDVRESVELIPSEVRHVKALVSAGMMEEYIDPKGIENPSYCFDEKLFDWRDVTYWNCFSAYRHKLYKGLALDVSQFSTAFYDVLKGRLVYKYEVTEDTVNMPDAAPMYEFPREWKASWIQDDNLDYCDAVDGNWIWSIGKEISSGRIVASTSTRLYQNKNFECLFLR